MRDIFSLRSSFGVLIAVAALAAMGCSSSATSDNPGGHTQTGSDASSDSTLPAPDATDSDVGLDAAQEQAPPVDDGTPTRLACTDNFGSAVTADYGRLDGFLVAIVPPSSGHSCSADSDHLHLQIQMNGAVYDVAVNVNDSASSADVYFTETDASMPGGAWSEGWHTGVHLDYVNNLQLHSSGFTAMSPAALAQQLESELQDANHISIFGNGYDTHDGVHDIHRNGTAYDGAIVIRPLSSPPHVLALHFADQSF